MFTFAPSCERKKWFYFAKQAKRCWAVTKSIWGLNEESKVNNKQSFSQKRIESGNFQQVADFYPSTGAQDFHCSTDTIQRARNYAMNNTSMPNPKWLLCSRTDALQKSKFADEYASAYDDFWLCPRNSMRKLQPLLATTKKALRNFRHWVHQSLFWPASLQTWPTGSNICSSKLSYPFVLSSARGSWDFVEQPTYHWMTVNLLWLLYWWYWKQFNAYTISSSTRHQPNI